MLRAIIATLLSAGLALTIAYGADADKKPAKKQQATFKKLDINDDGKLSLEEFRRIVDLRPKLKNKPGAVSKRFTKLDKNADGFVSLEEFKSPTKKKSKQESLG